jgi:RNA-directed DNA polymerase
MYAKLIPYLEKRGLELAMDKTRISHITLSFDFLGFNIRQYIRKDCNKLIIKPSKDNVKKAKSKISEIIRLLRGKNLKPIIGDLLPVIRGYANFWNKVSSKTTYSTIDYYIYSKISRFLRRAHPRKSWKWISKTYHKPDITGISRDKYLFTTPDGKYQLIRMAWTPIERHVLVKFKNSPYDKSLKEYYFNRDKREFNNNNIKSRQKLAKCRIICAQCVICLSLMLTRN